jgi:hypothetical protein
MKQVSVQEKVARWQDFADFMDSLPEEKFNISTWCRPDHTCKTTACVAGWGAIRYSDKVKAWIDKTYEVQKLEVLFNKARSQKKRDEIGDKLRLARMELFNMDNIDWSTIGREVLFLNNETAEQLFTPESDLWLGTWRVKNSDVALVFRYFVSKGKSILRKEKCDYRYLVKEYKPELYTIPQPIIKPSETPVSLTPSF